jgi:hypothetical protein
MMVGYPGPMKSIRQIKDGKKLEMNVEALY